jgi:hypothetical protein
MSFALVRQNKTGDSKTSMPAKAIMYHSNNSARSSHDSVIHPQCTFGNQCVQTFIPSGTGFDFGKIGIKPKLKISQPGDIYEQEADKVAEEVMRMADRFYSGTPVATTKGEELIDRKCSACEMKEEYKELNISRNSSPPFNLEINDETMNEISNIRSSGGSALDPGTKEFMESRFGGYDFSKVRIHTDDVAARSANSVNALAYTVRNDILFARQQYQPYTLEGKRLLAHELTHVVQQNTENPAIVDASSPLSVSHFRARYQRSTPLVTTSINQIARSLDPNNNRGTLPYRQATELQQCIRIMGEENAEYCRMEVIGEEIREIQGLGAGLPSFCEPNRALAWNDFRGTPGGGTHGASTSVSIPDFEFMGSRFFQARFNPDASWVRPRFRDAAERRMNGGDREVNRCQAHLRANPGGTWRMNDAPSASCPASIVPNPVTASSTDECESKVGTEWDRVAVLESARLLRHEQLHFDIACVLAKKANDALGRGVPIRDIRRAVNARLAELTVTPRNKYDRETNHGCNAGPQSSWENDVSNGLPQVTIP